MAELREASSSSSSNPPAPEPTDSGARQQGGEYALISNIPPEFHAADLRSFFSAYVEACRFDVFHYRRRKQRVVIQDTQQQPQQPPATAQEQPGQFLEPAAASSSTEVVRKCCVVRVAPGWRAAFIAAYHMKNWEDKKDVRWRSKCIIKPVSAAGHVGEAGARDAPKTPYLSRREAREARRSGERIDLATLSELRPPALLPRGNVGTPTKEFMQLIRDCRIPSRYLSGLAISFSRRGVAVPFSYGGGGGAKRRKRDPEEAPSGFESGEESDFDLDAEEWERHESLNDMPEKDIERSDRREADEYLYEEPTEVTWDKGSSGLVFYTDACKWDELVRGEKEDRERDDWDLDTRPFTEPDASDNAFRYGYRPIHGIDDADEARDPLARVKAGAAGRMMARMRWREGAGLGRREQGIPAPLDAVANPGRAGLGFQGAKGSSGGGGGGGLHAGRPAGLHPERHSPTPWDAPPVNVWSGHSATCWRKLAPEGPLVIASVYDEDYGETRPSFRRPRSGGPDPAPAPARPSGSFAVLPSELEPELEGPGGPSRGRWGDLPDPLLPSAAPEPPALFPAPSSARCLIRFTPAASPPAVGAAPAVGDAPAASSGSRAIGAPPASLGGPRSGLGPAARPPGESPPCPCAP
eukprot:tig00020816_g14132.t1